MLSGHGDAFPRVTGQIAETPYFGIVRVLDNLGDGVGKLETS